MCFIVGPKAVFVRKSRFVEIKLLLADSKRNNFCDDVKLKRIYRMIKIKVAAMARVAREEPFLLFT